MDDRPTNPAPEDKKLSALAGLGIVILCVLSVVLPSGLSKVIDSQALTFAAFACLTSGVFLFSMLWEPGKFLPALTLSVGAGFVLSLLGYFAAGRFSPGEMPDVTLVIFFIGQALFLLVGLLPYLQNRRATGIWSWKAAYIFTQAWNNGVLIYCSLMFSALLFAAFLAALKLAQSLEIDFFKGFTLSTTEFLALIAAGFGLGIAQFRVAPESFLKLRAIFGKIAQVSAAILIPVSVGFLILVLAVGVARYTQVSALAPVLMPLAVLGLLITNTYLYDNRGKEGRRFLHYAVLMLQPVLVILTALACYALYQRIAQYGLTPTRIGGAFVALVLLLHCLGGFASMIFWNRWVEICRRTRSLVTLTAVGVVALSLTPVADPFVLSAASQYRVIASGKVAPEEYDFHYLRRKLGDPGLQALARLRSEPGEASATVINRKLDEMQRPYPFGSKVALALAATEKVTADTLKDSSRIILIPEGLQLPSVLQGDFLGPFVSKASCELDDGPGCLIAAIELTDGDGFEYLIAVRKPDAGTEVWLLERHGARVRQTRLSRRGDSPELWSKLVNGEFAAIPANHYDLRIGDSVIRLRDLR